MHKIGFPVADATTFEHDSRPLTDVSFVWLPESFLLTVGNARTASEAQERLSALPLSMDPVVNRLVGQRSIVARAAHVAGNLLWREAVLEEVLDVGLKRQVIVDDAQRRFGSASAPEHPRLSMMLVVDVPGVGIALEFSGDGGGTLAERSRNFAERPTSEKPTNHLAFGKREMGEARPLDVRGHMACIVIAIRAAGMTTCELLYCRAYEFGDAKRHVADAGSARNQVRERTRAAPDRAQSHRSDGIVSAARDRRPETAVRSGRAR